MKIFLTGMTGFIGSYVAQALLERGDSIVALVRNPTKIPSLCTHARVQIVQGDLSDLSVVKRALQGCDACVHMALGWGETPITMLHNDTLATVTLLEMASQAGCTQFLYTSSTAAMGTMRPVMHEDLRNIPTDLYGATKAASEAYVLGFRKTPMRRNIIRPGYTFGSPVVADGVSQPDARFRNMAHAAKHNESIALIQHDGTQFVHAADLARLYLAVLDSTRNEEVYLGLADSWVAWQDIARRLLEMTHSTSRILCEDRGWGKDPCLFSVAKIHREFGLRFTSWPALENHLQWCIQQAD